MSYKTKIFKGIFVPLSARDIKILSDNNTLRMAYLDGLSYMHDLVINYTDTPDNSYYGKEDAIINCGQIKEKYFNGKGSLDCHFKDNFETASYFGSQADSIIAINDFEGIADLKINTSAYIKALLHTYNIVRTIE